MSENSTSTTQLDSSPIAVRLRNFFIVVVAVILTVSVFLGLRTETNSASLATIAESATSLEVALTNGKPTLMEFYADWCTSCQAMAPSIATLEQDYAERMNFVMLNVDNTKWLPEILHYRVDGIPHFVFLNQQGEGIATAIGEQPYSIMKDNLDSLVAELPLPHAKTSGQISSFSAPVSPNGATAPRSHGG